MTNSAGAVLDLDTYDEYGIPGSANTGRFQYTGQAWVPELGMYYYKARMYSPTLGRFMQTDPIGYGDGTNMYAYVGNDPVNGVDPTGLADPTGLDCESNTDCSPPDTAQIEGRARTLFVIAPFIDYNSGGLTFTPDLPDSMIDDFDESWRDTAAQQNGSVLENRGRRGGPVAPCPGMNGQSCGAPVRGGGINPDEPGVCKDCLGRNKRWPFGGQPTPESLKTVAVVGGVIIVVGGLILAPEITIPALLLTGATTAGAR